MVQKEDTLTAEALGGVGKTVINSYNFLNKLNEKYSVTGKVADYLDSSLGEVEIVAKGKDAYITATTKLSELDGNNRIFLSSLTPPPHASSSCSPPFSLSYYSYFSSSLPYFFVFCPADFLLFPY